MPNKEYDIAVIGGGPGGYVAAIRAAQQDACVCLVEADRVGGTCLNRGCIPTKALYSTALLKERLAHASDHGISVGEVGFDFSRAMERKDGVVEQLVGGIEQLLKSRSVDVIKGKASLEGEGQICIRQPGVTGRIKAKKIIIATGSLPARPQALSIDGKNILTSNEILAIKDLPESLLVIGGGYIGCEFAGIFAALGSRVTIVEALPQILSLSDRQIVREVEKSFKERSVAVHVDTAVESLEVTPDGVRAKFGDQEQLFAKVLVAVGRVPNITGLDLDSVGVEVENGAIKVDEGLRTSASDIYAIGDVTGGIQLAHVASYQAGIAVANALGGNESTDYSVVPSAIFTLPEIGQVGLTETECKEQGITVNIGRFAYMASGKALCDGESRGSIKIMAEKKSDRIVGAAIVGAEASALISEVAVAMTHGLTAGQLGEVIHAHPTLPEIVLEAAEDVGGHAIHKAGRKKK
ncbi:MAG: dihydrolipoyl dehydrogenase [Desulfuromonas sp.]|nr:MAG: dihydrolipoyl dehydrogenase [Desulfuromonas sp.]